MLSGAPLRRAVARAYQPHREITPASIRLRKEGLAANLRPKKES